MRFFRFRNLANSPDSPFFAIWPQKALKGDSSFDITEMGARFGLQAPAKVSAERLRFGQFLIILLFLGVIFRVGLLMWGQGGNLRAVAEDNRTLVTALPSHRGVLRDKNGIILAENIPVFILTIDPRPFLDQNLDREAIFGEAAKVLNLPVDNLISAWIYAQDKKRIVSVSGNVEYQNALAFISRAKNFPGLSVTLSERRHYLTADIPSLSHVIGYTGPLSGEEYEQLSDEGYQVTDHLGKVGIESQYEPVLRGTYGSEEAEVDAKGRPTRILSRREPIDGLDLTLTIDARLQAYTETVLSERLKDAPSKRAAVVALDPSTGAVRALVSYPGFDANAFTEGIDLASYEALAQNEDAPLFPRAVSGSYPSGSTIKPIFASAALTEGIVAPETTFLSTGGLSLGDRFFPDWRPGGHGYTNVYHAIADSVNTFFYMIGGGTEQFAGLGLESLVEYANLFGLGRATGIDLPVESSGFLPSKAWKLSAKGEPWYIGDTYNVSIGQGDVLVTPLQIARATAAIAAGGLLPTPYVVERSDRALASPRIISDEVATVVRDAMRQTVTDGTARQLKDIPVAVAGKTGTAQWSSTLHPHSWFTGFAPFDNPDLVITVLVEQGGDLNLATPIAHDILAWYYAQRP